ncbi:MAG TPA: hypothetical protein VMU49_09040 [Candidatus Acidoferrales bacterium]|nr:hypothetical protein [Candidatus Acidoferrales bacterium]
MSRYLEAAFTHRLALLTPVVVALLAALGFVLMQAPAYQSTAKLWVNWGGGNQTAADAQVATITQLVATKSFDSQVAQQGPLAQYLAAHGGSSVTGIRSLIGALTHPGSGGATKPTVDDEYNYLSSRVTAVSVGPQIVSITVTGPTPAVAQGTATAVIAQLQKSDVAARLAPLTTQITYYKQQLAAQSTVLQNALAAVHQYESSHPGFTSSSPQAAADYQYQLLNQQSAVASATYSQLLTTVNQLQNGISPGQLASVDPFSITDTPQLPTSVSRFGKKELLGLAAGVLAGLLAMILVLATLVRFDTTIHSSDEAETRLGLRLAGEIPQVRMR